MSTTPTTDTEYRGAALEKLTAEQVENFRVSKASAVAFLHKHGRPASMRQSVAELKAAVIAYKDGADVVNPEPAEPERIPGRCAVCFAEVDVTITGTAGAHKHNGRACRGTKVQALPVDPTPADLEPDAPVVHPEGSPERLAAAKAEHKTLQAWIKDGEKPPRPATPNLDAMNEAHAAGRTANNRPKAKKAAGSRTRSTNPHYLASQERARTGEKRGKGIPVDDETLERQIRVWLSEDPSLTRNQAEQISYWIKGWACGIDRFNRIFDEVRGQIAQAAPAAA